MEWRNRNTIEENGHVFCCYGKPGAGKTVIRYGAKCSIIPIPITNVHSSVVIDDLRSQFPDIGVAYLYADYKDQANQTMVNILGTFLHQLLITAREYIPNGDEVIRKFKSIDGGLTAKRNLYLLKVRLNQLKHAFICIDAVDELEPKVRRQLLNVLKELNTGNTSLFLTGRGHIDSEVQEHFQVATRYTVVIGVNQPDIQTFVRQQIADDPYLDAMDELLEKEIINTITRKSQGM